LLRLARGGGHTGGGGWRGSGGGARLLLRGGFLVGGRLLGRGGRRVGGDQALLGLGEALGLALGVGLRVGLGLGDGGGLVVVDGGRRLGSGRGLRGRGLRGRALQGALVAADGEGIAGGERELLALLGELGLHEEDDLLRRLLVELGAARQLVGRELEDGL